VTSLRLLKLRMLSRLNLMNLIRPRRRSL